MNSWFSWFSSSGSSSEASQTPTRLESSQDLKTIFPILEELRARQEILRKAAEGDGDGSLSSRKHIIVSTLLNQLDAEIAAFNQNPSHENPAEEIKAIKILTLNLFNIVKDNYDPNSEVLCTNRDNKRQIANAFIHFSSMFGAGAAYIATPLPVLGTIAAVLAAGILNTAARDASGLRDITPRSAVLIIDLAAALEKINNKIALDLDNPVLHRM